MSYSDRTIKRLFARSQNQCAMPKCIGRMVVGETVIGEICHIRARRKNGPRFDPNLTPAERNAYENLLLLCPTCHKLVDRNAATYSVDLLTDIKTVQENEGGLELSPSDRRAAMLLIESLKPKSRAKASARGNGVAIAVGGDNHGNITINQPSVGKSKGSRYPKNSIGADANLCGYVDYLFGLAIDYWQGATNMGPARLGKKIKTKFRLKQRTRNHLPIDRFEELVSFIVHEMLEPSPVGKQHRHNGTKLCRTFEEWRSGPM